MPRARCFTEKDYRMQNTVIHILHVLLSAKSPEIDVEQAQVYSIYYSSTLILPVK